MATKRSADDIALPIRKKAHVEAHVEEAHVDAARVETAHVEAPRAATADNDISVLELGTIIKCNHTLGEDERISRQSCRLEPLYRQPY